MNLDHIRPLVGPDPGLKSVSNGFGAVGLINRAPHPNAAKVYLNWLLSRDAQAIFAEKTLYNSRRTDVPPVTPDRALDPKETYINLTNEEHGDKVARAQQLAKQLIR